MESESSVYKDSDGKFREESVVGQVPVYYEHGGYVFCPECADEHQPAASCQIENWYESRRCDMCSRTIRGFYPSDP